MWRQIAARATGSSHRRTGTPCQDGFACEVFALPGAPERGRPAEEDAAGGPLPGGDCAADAASAAGAGSLSAGSTGSERGDCIVAAVADGAGSAPNSARGAEIAVRTTVAEARAAVEAGRTDYAGLLREAALCARAAVLAEAAGAGADARTYASTLLAAVFTPEGGAALQIGDGAIVVKQAGGVWGWVFWPEQGEYVNTTYFLTGDDAPERLKAATLAGEVLDVALTTDGLQPLVLHYATKTAHAPFFDAMFRPLLAAGTPEALDRLSAALAAYLGSEQIATRTDDDVTLLLATRRGADRET